MDFLNGCEKTYRFSAVCDNFSMMFSIDQNTFTFMASKKRFGEPKTPLWVLWDYVLEKFILKKKIFKFSLMFPFGKFKKYTKAYS